MDLTSRRAILPRRGDSLAFLPDRRDRIIIINKQNIGAINDLEKFAAELKVKTNLFSVSSAKKDDFAVKDITSYYDALHKVWGRSPVFQKKSLRRMRNTHALCGAFLDTGSITGEGNVLPCPFADAVLGNMFHEDLELISRRSFRGQAIQAFFSLCE